MSLAEQCFKLARHRIVQWYVANFRKIVEVRADFVRELEALDDGQGAQPRPRVDVVVRDPAFADALWRVDQRLQALERLVEFRDELICHRDGLGVVLVLLLLRQLLPRRLVEITDGNEMVRDEGAPSVALHELRQRRHDVARPLRQSHRALYLLLPSLEVRTPRSRLNQASLTKGVARIDLLNDVERLWHWRLVAVNPDGCNLFAYKASRRLYVVVRQEVYVVLDVLQAKRETNANAEGAMVIDIHCRQRRRNDTRRKWGRRSRNRGCHRERECATA
mmetsp:Transcript_27261/g.63704  ORF Transcript_27261/g.63704 Transcript_27261/m.63704 type:complete len:277 (+) Transcript_27261:325-1155(+)